MKGSVLFLLKAITIAAAVLYIGACLTPYLHPRHAWPLTLLALGYPVLAVLLLTLIIGWLLVDKRISGLLLLLLLAGYQNLVHVFAVSVSAAQNTDSSLLKVITWNVRSFDNNARHAEAPDAIRRRMINFLKSENADVLLLQEFVEIHNPLIYSNIATLRDSLGYKYYYAPADLSTHFSYGLVEFGSAIFSKWPLTDTSKLAFDGLALPEHAITGVVTFRGKKVRVFTTHLASFNLYAHKAASNDEAIPRSDSAFINNASMLSKLVYYDRLHTSQAQQLKAWMNKFMEPAILSGDFNLVPSAFPYHILKQNMRDAFLQKGAGVGRTFSSLSPTLRIDYIFTSKQLDVCYYNCRRLYLSDHFPVVANINLP